MLCSNIACVCSAVTYCFGKDRHCTCSVCVQEGELKAKINQSAWRGEWGGHGTGRGQGGEGLDFSDTAFALHAKALDSVSGTKAGWRKF